MRILSVLCVLAFCSSAAAQGLDDLYEYTSRPTRAVAALEDIHWELSMMRTDNFFNSFNSPSGGSYGGGGGAVMVYEYQYPTKAQWKHYFRLQRAEAKRAAYRARVAARLGE